MQGEAYDSNSIQARREAEAKKKSGRGGATAVTFAMNPAPLAPTHLAVQPTLLPGDTYSLHSALRAPVTTSPSLTPNPSLTSPLQPAMAMPPAQRTQHQQQQDTAQKIASQMKSLGIAQMVLPSDPSSRREADLSKPDSKGGERLMPDAKVSITVPRRGVLQCYVLRDKSSFKTMMNPRYSLHVTRTSQFLLAGRKRANKQTSNYLISTDEEDLERDSNSYFGKVRSNVAGTEFVVYDKGCKPGEEKPEGPFLREELCGILYETNVAGSKGPRKMTVVLPALLDDDSHRQWKPRTDEEGLLAEYKRNPDSKELVVLVSKEPTWNEQLRSYQLNFHGRVTKASVKNFQLCDARQPNKVVLQFGKVEDSKFNMDFQHPLTAVQAFGICLSAFDNKLACQ